MFSESRRRELHTGSLRQLAGPSRRDRVVIAVSLALVVVALILVIARRDPEPTPAPPAEVRVVTVPVPMPIEKPVPVVPAPVEPPAPRPVVIAHPTPAPRAPEPPPAPPAEKTPSADELVALYRSVGQTLQQLDQDHGDALRARFRWIRLADYLETPEKRAEAARMLDAIASDARGQ